MGIKSGNMNSISKKLEGTRRQTSRYPGMGNRTYWRVIMRRFGGVFLCDVLLKGHFNILPYFIHTYKKNIS